MKQKPADRRNWQRVTKSRFAQISLDASEFRGYATLFCIDEVREPLWGTSCGRYLCLADKGYSWMQHFPAGARYAITTVFDAHDEIVEWYIVICNRHYLDEQGLVWYEDLYLDLDVSFEGEVVLLDADELATVIIERSLGRPARVLKGGLAERILQTEAELEQAGVDGQERLQQMLPLIAGSVNRRASLEGELEEGFVWAGQVAGLIRDIPSTRELIERMVGEAWTITRALQQVF